MEKNLYREIEIIDMNSPLLGNENMQKYNLVEIINEGNELYVIPNIGVKKGYYSKIFYDVSSAPISFKEKYKTEIKEVKVKGTKETKSFLKTLADNIRNKKYENNIINIIDSTATSLSALTVKEKSKISNPCQFDTTKEGLRKKEILTAKQIEDTKPLYYDVSSLSTEDLTVWSKIYSEVIELKKQDNGLYIEVDSLTDKKNQTK